MPGPWITDEELLADLQDAIHVDPADIAGFWAGIITRAVEEGYTVIKNVLMGKGYTMAQLDAWDDRKMYTRMQSLFFAVTRGGGPEDQSDRDIKRYDYESRWQKMEAAEIALSIGGVMVKPGGDGSGAMVGAGCLAVHNAGIDYGTSFGLVVNRRGGKNQYGDDLPPAAGVGIR